MPYTYTNRHGKTYWVRAVETKTGKLRYYLTTSEEFPNLIEEVPEGFEVTEKPEDARVIIRKKKPVFIHPDEKELLQDAIAEFSAIKDFFIHAEGTCLSVYHSQFNYMAGIEPNLSREEAIEAWGDNIERWMRFYCSLRFQLVDKETRLFQAEREVRMGLHRGNLHPIGDPGPLEEVAKAYGYHLGRESFYRLEPKGWGEDD